jgi:hypothetical protein
VGDLWGWLFQVGLLLFPLAALVVVVVAILQVSRRRPSGGMARDRPNVEMAMSVGSIAPEPLGPAERRAATASAVAMAVSGLCLPWVVGLSVKLYLDFIGEPTLPVSSFLEPVVVVVLLGATIGHWCCPFLVLAAWVRARGFVKFAPDRTFRERLLLAWFAHMAGLVAGVAIFVPVFREWDIMYIFVPIAVFIVVPMVAAYAVGRLALRVRDAWRGEETPAG